jgi:hypothetical protein
MKKNNDLIQDTSAPPMVLDMSNEAVTIEKMLEAQRNTNDKTNITFSIEKWKVNTLKKLALERSVKESKNITYTDLIKECIDKNYFVEKKQ